MDFFIKYKKLIVIILFLAFIVIVVYFLYALFFRPVTAPAPSAGTTATGTATGELPSAGAGGHNIVNNATGTLPVQPGATLAPASAVAKGGLTQTNQLANVPALGATLSSDGQELQYYNKSDGKFYRIDNDGVITPLTDKIFYDVSNITWAPDKNKAILEYPDGSNIVYDFSTQKQYTLPSHWQNYDFSPDSSQIVAKSMGLDPSNRWLVTSNIDGTSIKPIEQLGNNGEEVYDAWSPNNQSIAMFTQGLDFNREEVYFIGKNNENFKSAVIEGRGFQPLWSPDGNRLLYSTYSTDNDSKPMLWIVNAKGDAIGTGRQSLGVETWANKCTFDGSDTLYCAVPNSLPAGAGLMPELAKTSSDSLYSINVNTGVKKLVAVPNGSYNMSDLMVSNNGYNLYFTDSATNRLYQIKLK